MYPKKYIDIYKNQRQKGVDEIKRENKKMERYICIWIIVSKANKKREGKRDQNLNEEERCKNK